jgi:hypothetical protein
MQPLICVFHAKWTGVPGETGQSVHGEMDSQSERSDAGFG